MLNRHLNSSQAKSLNFSIFPGAIFKPILWKADFDMDFSTGCLYCGDSQMKGYNVVDESGNAGKVAVCTECLKVNAQY